MFSFNFNKFYLGLLKREYVFDDYLNKYPNGRKIYKKEILHFLNMNFNQKDSASLRATTTVADLDGVDFDYTEMLIKLLKEKWHQSHEDIVMLLEKIRDPKSIDSLYETSLHIPDYDDGRSLAKKCIWALGAINTTSSKEKLQILSISNDPIIKKTATMQLNHVIN